MSEKKTTTTNVKRKKPTTDNDKSTVKVKKPKIKSASSNTSTKKLGELTNGQLDHMFGHHANYLPATSKDTLPDAQQLQRKFIFINLQDHNTGPGTHWVLLFNATNPHVVTYFDPMGESSPPTEISKRMAEMSELIGGARQRVYNNTDFQQLGSSSCGYWCAYAVDWFLLHKSSDYSALHSLSNSLKMRRNDQGLQANEMHLRSFFHGGARLTRNTDRG